MVIVVVVQHHTLSLDDISNQDYKCWSKDYIVVVDATIFSVACVINVGTGILYYCFHALSFLFNRIGTRL